MKRARASLFKIARDCHGTAAIDYALLLALVTGFVILGAELFGAGIGQATAGLAAGMEREPAPRRAAVVPVARELAHRRREAVPACEHPDCSHADCAEHDCDDCADCHLEQPRWHLPLLTLALVSGCPLWFALRKSRKPTPSESCAEDAATQEPSRAGTPKILAKRQECLRALVGEPELLLEGRIQVAHVMTSPAIVASASDSIQAVAARMQEANVRQMVVVDASQRVLGLIRQSDLAGPGPSTVQGRMLQTPVVTPEMALNAVATLLLARHDSCLPVVEKDRCVGILSLSDLAIALQCTLQMVQKLALEAS